MTVPFGLSWPLYETLSPLLLLWQQLALVSVVFTNVISVNDFRTIQLVDLAFAVDRFTRPSIVQTRVCFRRRQWQYRFTAEWVLTNSILDASVVSAKWAIIGLYCVQIFLYRATSLSLPDSDLGIWVYWDTGNH